MPLERGHPFFYFIMQSLGGSDEAKGTTKRYLSKYPPF